MVLDTHIKYAVYVYSSGAQPKEGTGVAGAGGGRGGEDLTDSPEYQLHLVLRIFLLSMLEHVVFAVAVVVTALVASWGVEGSSSSSSSSSSSGEGTSSSSDAGLAVRKLLQCVLYPNFGQLLVVFVMIWDQQMIVANIISVLVLTSQYRALQAVTSHPSLLRAPGRPEGSSSAELKPMQQSLRHGLPLVVGLLCRSVLRLTL